MGTLSFLLKKVIAFFSLTLFLLSCSDDKKDYLVTIKTPHGDMKAILYDETPKHKENFLKLAKEGFYDSLLFHRIIDGFMIQGGDPESKNAEQGQRLGQGSPGYTIPAEFNKKFIHEKGALAAARKGGAGNPTKASSGSQFYIAQGKKYTEKELKKMTIDYNNLYRLFSQLIQDPEFSDIKNSYMEAQQSGDGNKVQEIIIEAKEEIEKKFSIELDTPLTEKQIEVYTSIGGVPHLDNEYTVFGKVIDGLEVLDKIASQKKDRSDRPLEDIRMEISVEQLPKKKITKLYGYKYE